VALSAAKMDEWMSADLSKLDLLAIQIDSLHIKDELVMVAAVGIDAEGHKHPLALVDGATENAATVQALLDDLRHSLAYTNIIENMMGTIRRVTHNVKRWRNVKMALRGTAAGMMEAKKGFLRIEPTGSCPS
jgi:transposase-like protein